MKKCGKKIPTVTKKRASQMFRRLIRNIEGENLHAFDVGKELHEINETRAYEHLGFPAFRDFLDSLPMSLSWCRDRLRIYRHFVLRLRIPRKKLARLTAGKADMIADIVTRKNIDLWIKRCAKSSEEEIRAMVAEEKGRGLPEPCRRMSFVLTSEERLIVDAAIHLMQHQDAGYRTNRSVALVRMCEIVLGRRALKRKRVS